MEGLTELFKQKGDFQKLALKFLKEKMVESGTDQRIKEEFKDNLAEIMKKVQEVSEKFAERMQSDLIKSKVGRLNELREQMQADQFSWSSIANSYHLTSPLFILALFFVTFILGKNASILH